MGGGKQRRMVIDEKDKIFALITDRMAKSTQEDEDW